MKAGLRARDQSARGTYTLAFEIHTLLIIRTTARLRDFCQRILKALIFANASWVVQSAAAGKECLLCALLLLNVSRAACALAFLQSWTYSAFGDRVQIGYGLCGGIWKSEQCHRKQALVMHGASSSVDTLSTIAEGLKGELQEQREKLSRCSKRTRGETLNETAKKQLAVRGKPGINTSEAWTRHIWWPLQQTCTGVWRGHSKCPFLLLRSVQPCIWALNLTSLDDEVAQTRGIRAAMPIMVVGVACAIAGNCGAKVRDRKHSIWGNGQNIAGPRR